MDTGDQHIHFAPQSWKSNSSSQSEMYELSTSASPALTWNAYAQLNEWKLHIIFFLQAAFSSHGGIFTSVLLTSSSSSQLFDSNSRFQSPSSCPFQSLDTVKAFRLQRKPFIPTRPRCPQQPPAQPHSDREQPPLGPASSPLGSAGEAIAEI